MSGQMQKTGAKLKKRKTAPIFFTDEETIVQDNILNHQNSRFHMQAWRGRGGMAPFLKAQSFQPLLSIFLFPFLEVWDNLGHPLLSPCRFQSFVGPHTNIAILKVCIVGTARILLVSEK